MMDLSSIISLIKLATPVILTGITLCTGFLLFISSNILLKIDLLEFKTNNSSTIGFVFILSISLLFAHLVFFIIRLLSKKINTMTEERRSKQQIDELNSSLTKLTPQEKEYLQPFIFNSENTLYIPIGDGVIGGLQAKKIVYRSSNVGNVFQGFAYNLQPWAREYLKDHTELLT